jgi:aminoglycoside phosphotransferase (APT) family kinase protein
VVDHDPAAARLVLRSPARARDWNDHHGRGRFSRLPARLLGRVLAALHRLPGDAVASLPMGVDRMWALALPDPPYERLLELSAGAQDLVARLQGSPPMCHRLLEMRSATSETNLIHGDLRWDNCLAVAADGSRRRTRLLVVDWELAGSGAAAFDVGSVLAEYLRVWIGSIPIIDPRDPGRLVAHARHPLSRMRPAIQAFWRSYRLASQRPARLRRVIELAGVRLLQTAVERAQGVARPSPHVIALAHVADNLLSAPDDAARFLLGLEE